ncbi:YncE family protein [Paenibacillus tritici]|uniref:YncE family protein n=1 Tax=Paenibacillus tritici TaxID=1873425 RepID=UPI001BABD11A|nr:YncE family protein [Paenibacillus tritici]QUL54637.1 YncE family protein [Paenibacillus tritici]
MNPNKAEANSSRKLPSRDPYVYVTYEIDYQHGYVAVIDPVEARIIKRIQVGANPGAMAMDPDEKKLFVANTRIGSLSIIDTSTHSIINTVPVGNMSSIPARPVAVLVASNGKKAYVANYGNKNVTIIDSLTNTVLKNVDVGPGRPFALASNENSSYIYVACKVADGKDYVAAISIADDSVHPYGSQFQLTFDTAHNPLVVHPDGHTQIALGQTGMLIFYAGELMGEPTTSSLLDNTVSGVYLDNKLLFCTMEDNRGFLKLFNDLEVDWMGTVYSYPGSDIPSYKGQDKIRLSRRQVYIGITIQPTTLPTGGLQIYNSTGTESRFVPLTSIGDLAFFSDTKAYVGESRAIRPIDLATGVALPAIEIGPTESNPIAVKNIISGYRNQS